MGAGPDPIPVDKLTTARLAAAFTFMQRPECREAAAAAAAAITAEDGVGCGMEAFHRHLPAYLREGATAEERARGRVDWQLTRPHVVDVLTETVESVVGMVTGPAAGAVEGGFSGALDAAAASLLDLNLRPAKGLWSSARATEQLGAKGVAGASRAVTRLRLAIKNKLPRRQRGAASGGGKGDAATEGGSGSPPLTSAAPQYPVAHVVTY